MKNNKKILFIVLGIVILVILVLTIITIVIFKHKSNNKNSLNEEQIEIEKLDVIPEKKVQVVDVDSNIRPYAVMINNLNDARAVQSGLSQAYLVYEIIVEGGITRYLALFKDANLSQIGSVRSARHYYLDYVLENDAIYVHWGWSPQAQEDIRTLKINNINGLTYEGVYFYRSNPLGLSSEHTGFTNTEMLNNAITKLGYNNTTDKGLLLNYSAESVNYEDYGDVQDASSINITYSNYIKDLYEYDEENKVYKRYVNGKEQKDYNTSEQLTVKNIIVYAIENYTISGDTKGRQFLNNIGGGDGYLISEGKAIKINWSKSSRSEKTKYAFENGEEIIVNDGNTFIQIMPLTGTMEIN